MIANIDKYNTFKNDALVIQHAYDHHMEFVDMMRLSYPRHSAYCKAHNFDYWHMLCDVPGLNVYQGGWAKVKLIKQALEWGYKTVVWLDCDAAVWNMECDLREALPGEAQIGACWHDPEKSAYLKQNQVPPHYNVGVLYVRQGALEFINDWLGQYGAVEQMRFKEQEIFNGLIATDKYAPLFARLDDTWNATVGVNAVPRPNVLAWHGVWPNARRVEMMRSAMANDFINFRV